MDGSTEVVVANVGGRPIPLRELVAKWVLRDPGGVRAILDDLVLSRIIVYEAAALQIELPEGAVEEAVKEQVAVYEKEALDIGAPDLDTYVRKRLGMEPRALLANLEKDAAINLLAPRCVRAWLLQSDRREVRAITVKDSVGVDQVQARLARGDAFAEVARELSTDPSAQEGGRMPPLVRGDLMLARAAFASDVGDVAGPMEDSGSLVFIKVEAAPERLVGLWPEIGEQVEASLEARKIEDPEFWQWKDAMSLRYEADVTPFLDLAR